MTSFFFLDIKAKFCILIELYIIASRAADFIVIRYENEKRYDAIIYNYLYNYLLFKPNYPFSLAVDVFTASQLSRNRYLHAVFSSTLLS